MTVANSASLDAVFAIELPARPYPGLRPFQDKEWPIFFGRERMVDAAIDRLLIQGLLVVHGDSGCGKSSLVRAGMLPRLEQDGARGGVRWRTCIAEPGDRPLWNLAQAIAGSDDVDGARAIEIRRLLNQGRAAAAALAGFLGTRAGAATCIVIDQFEELFGHASRSGPVEARLLTEFLAGLRDAPPVGLFAITTMRSEFLGHCARYGDFAETVNATQYLLPRMTSADMVRAIQEPATLYDGEVSLGLAERLIADSGAGQDELPLIQHGLMRLYDAKLAAMAAAGAVSPGARWRLGLEDYRHDGKLAGLLSDHADSVQADAEKRHLAAPGHARVVEDMFRALTEINADGAAIRRPRTLRQLAAVCGVEAGSLAPVIDAFRADGISFLRPHGRMPLDESSRIDISHEALIRCWTRIAEKKDGWLIREFRNGLVWRALLVQAESFERNPANVLAPETADERAKWLERRNAAWAERYGGGWERVRKLIDASVAGAMLERQRKADELLAAEKARLREAELASARQTAVAEKAKRRWAVAGLSSMALLVAIAGGLAWFGLDQAQRARDEAERANSQAAIAERQAREIALALDKAEDERLKAQSIAAQLQDEIKRAETAQRQAEQTQASAAQAYASSISGVSTSQILERLRQVNDPYALSILTQGLAETSRGIAPGELDQLIRQLLVNARRTTDPSAIAAINQAFVAVVPRLSTERQIDAVETALRMLAEPPPSAGLAASAATLAAAISAPQLAAFAESKTPEEARQLLYSLFAGLTVTSPQDAERLQSLRRALAGRAALPAPRVYVHIATEGQRAPAQRFATQLAGTELNGDRIVVPGIERVERPPSRSALRCFRAEECRLDAPPLLDAVKRILRADGVVIEDLGQRITGTVQRRHFEIWFAPGDIGASTVDLTRAQVIQIMPNAASVVDAWVDPLNEAMSRYRIDTPARAAAFLAQIAHESAELRRVQENLNYPWERLRNVFPRFFPTDEAAKAYDRQPERIANRIYANRMSNGDEASSDGWRYRGRGPFLVVGRENYRKAGQAIGVDLEADPERMLEPKIGALIAAWFWDSRGLNALADADNDNGFRETVRRISGGYHGLEERTAFWRRARAAFGLPDLVSGK